MELIFPVGLVAALVSIAWIVWKTRAREQGSELEQAWRIVLADPHYEQRRHYEEHKHKVEAELRKEAKDLGAPPS